MNFFPAIDILHYWFKTLGPEGWFAISSQVDAEIRHRFLGIYDSLKTRPLAAFEDDILTAPDTALAAILMFDQFPRNMFRGHAAAFESDPLALALTTRAIELGHDMSRPEEERIFFYLPFEHSENLADQDTCLQLIKSRCPNDEFIRYAEVHRDIIARFGRFPHRNAILGRPSTAEEQEYLNSDSPTFGTVTTDTNA